MTQTNLLVLCTLTLAVSSGCSRLREVRGSPDGGPDGGADSDADAAADADSDADADTDLSEGARELETEEIPVVVTNEPDCREERAIGPSSLVAAMDGGSVVVAWRESLFIEADQSNETFVMRLGLDGEPIAEVRSVIRRSGAARSDEEVLVRTDPEYAAVYVDERGGEREIYTRAIDTELIADDELRLTSWGGPVDGAAGGWSGEELGVAFRAAGVVWFLRAVDSGTVADSLRQLTVGGTADHPTVVAADGGFGVAFSDDREGQNDIFFALVGADGEPAGEDALKVAPTEGDSTSAHIAWTGTEFAVVWRDSIPDESPTVSFARVDASGTPIEGSFRQLLPYDGEPDVAGYEATANFLWALLWTGADLQLVLSRGGGTGGEFHQELSVFGVNADGSLSADGPSGVATAVRDPRVADGVGINDAKAAVIDARTLALVWNESETAPDEACPEESRLHFALLGRGDD